MEEILGQEMQPPISLKEFLADWKTSLKSMTIPECHEDIQDAMNLSADPKRFKNVTAQCCLEQLQQDNDANIIKFEPGTSHPSRNPLKVNETNLKTYQEINNSKERMQRRNPFKRSREIYPMIPLPVQHECEQYEPCNFYNDIIVKVRIYRPARAVHTGQSLEKPVFSEEFECLGTNYLTDLRDKISCVCKKKRFFDISNNPTAELPAKATDPAFFFINNTFYNDRRNPNNADYSEVIRNWAKKAVGLKDLRFKVAQMETTRFLDLTVSLGFPQLYQHHGNCEHVFIISQVDLLIPSIACKQRELYPRLCSFVHFNTRVCNMCGTGRYTFIVTKSDRQLHDPAYICKKCFFDYHYIDGNKIGEFHAYRVNEFNEDEEVNFSENVEVEAENASEENEELLAGVDSTRNDTKEDREFTYLE
ncbi:PREDICTED: snRNA-activating protein complex subunit 3 [Rhagoletis zephyria]|uniref:snRNA-activating protein complex subunit 3 n=1 Tax=Rhagoletis zephyria TaxID=28612 RepID=UPI0008117990|nr:PREDICTED: snRNA-activating protein complex subunit 3 [Rhagoletis zephyria]XP_017492781.1 PREDICTED: snRNA-activating protein complex subunit 3 [Rhagoletis zephyria]